MGRMKRYIPVIAAAYLFSTLGNGIVHALRAHYGLRQAIAATRAEDKVAWREYSMRELIYKDHPRTFIPGEPFIWNTPMPRTVEKR